MKATAMPPNTAISAGVRLRAAAKPTGMKKSANGGAEGRKRFDSRQNREFYDRCGNDADGGGQRECKGAEVGQIAFR